MKWSSQGLAGSLARDRAAGRPPASLRNRKTPPKETEPKSGGTFDSAVKSIKRGAQAAEDAVKEQYAKARPRSTRWGSRRGSTAGCTGTRPSTGEVDIEVTEGGPPP